MNKLKDKRALVTGGGTGIGAAAVMELADRGATVGIHFYRSEESAKALEARLIKQGIKVKTFQADLTDPDQAKQMVADFTAWAGGMDVLINNAGDIVARKTLEQMDENFAHKVMALNLDSALFVTQAALPFLKQSGKEFGASIVNMSSLAGRLGAGTGATMYCAAKGAVQSWTRALARELAADGIRVNAVAPGLILETKFHQTHTPKEAQEQIIATIPLKRAGNPGDVARAIVYFASEYDGFITGAVLDINGGVYGS